MKKSVDVEDKYIKWFSSLHFKDVPEAGGKAANLGEMYNIGMPVPQGFVILAKAYSYFLEATGIKNKIYKLLENIDLENTKELDEVASLVRELILNAIMPEDLEKEITEAYDLFSFNEEDLHQATSNVLRIMKNAREPSFVAVRSSATAEDSSEASFAGQQETFLNVKGKINLIEAVKRCFASLFTARSVYYRIKKGFKHEKVLIAVVIQLMVNSDKSGVIFTHDPVNQNENIVIESVYGLGEGIVSGRIEPDHCVVSRDLKILEKKIAVKNIAIVRNSEGKNSIVKLSEDRSKSQVLTDSEIRKLAEYSIKLEEHYKKPQDIEFAISSNEIFIVQTRPITTLGKEGKYEEVEGKKLLEGLPASPGIGSGEVKVVHKIEELEKIRKGDILVTEMTNPDMVVSMQKAAAIITDEGGSTCHAAIVSREMGIPCVVGTKRATKILRDGMFVTVDGFRGIVYEGKVESLKAKKVEIKKIVNTKTKIKVIVDLPDFALRAKETGCKDVGLTRIEGIIAESGKHPFYFIKNKDMGDYEKVVHQGVSKIAEHFEELWIRTSDIRSDEYRHLKGAPSKIEINPMLGMHGIRMSVKYPEILNAEIKALAKIDKKIGVMMPQIISVEEVREVKKVIHEIKASHLKLGIMIETPAAVQIIEDLCKEGIKFISFGTNDLTQYTLAIDRGNEDVQYLYNEMHPAVLAQLAKVIEVCKKYHVETSICGQAGSNKDMVEFLVKHGIDSISCNADKAGEISEFVQQLEGKKEEKIPEKDEKKNHQTNCSSCNKLVVVPFKPDGVRPVYCKICLEVDRQKKLAEKTRMPEDVEERTENAIESSEIREDAKPEVNADIIQENTRKEIEDELEDAINDPEIDEIIDDKLDIF